MQEDQKTNLYRALEIVGTIVFVIGVVYWYSTPGYVVAAPATVILVGAGTFSAGYFLKRNQGSSQAQDLAARARTARMNMLQNAGAAQENTEVAVATFEPAHPVATPDAAAPGRAAGATHPERSEPETVDLYSAAVLVADPTTSAQTLAQIAGAHPQLLGHIRLHPNTYPELVQWIDAVTGNHTAS
ncbi:MAG: hypothetical protein ACK5LO_15980 [Leucobacter sp.]